MTDEGLMFALSIGLFSTGHYFGGTVALALGNEVEVPDELA